MSAAPAIAARLLAWFDRHGRHDLPWQHPRTPYRVWLSEIMLQQTQVAVVEGYFERFVAALPDLPTLARAPQDNVLALWSGLGYYARARHLHAAAKLCLERHGGELPRSLDALVALPGIGRSTAGAILAQAWGDPAPILDGNVKRVLCRVFGIEGWPGRPAVEKRLWAIAETLLPPRGWPTGPRRRWISAPRCAPAPIPPARFVPCRTFALRGARAACRNCPRQNRASRCRSARPTCCWPRMATAACCCSGAPTGVWAGLWSLPQLGDAAQARAWFRDHLRGDATAAQPLQPIEHAFSHYRLRLHPLHVRADGLKPRIADNDDLRWARRAELSAIGLPAPIRKLLQEPTA
ncbi:A/G-specific adenine glycosylase [Thermomonas sp. S9]|nr:A/G-specific adenine glycosylase [Thermomonas sp. S9]